MTIAEGTIWVEDLSGPRLVVKPLAERQDLLEEFLNWKGLPTRGSIDSDVEIQPSSAGCPLR